MDVLRELIPRDGLSFSETGKLIDAIMQSATQRVIAELDAVHRDDCKLRGQAAILREVEQSGHEFAPGQITGSAKNNEHRRFELVVRFLAGCRNFHWKVFINVATGFVSLPKELLLRHSAASLAPCNPSAVESQPRLRCKRSRLIRPPAGEDRSFPAAPEGCL